VFGSLDAARTLLAEARRERSREERGALAIELAHRLLEQSLTRAHHADRARAQMLARLMHDPYGQALTTALTDRIYRSKSPERIVDQVAHLLERYGVPHYMGALERASLTGVGLLSKVKMAPRLLAGAVLDRVRKETRAVLLPAEEAKLAAHLAARHRERVRVNVNWLGEALLGEREAEARVAKYVKLAQRPGIDALSVKVSSIGSQLNLMAFEHTTEVLAERLSRIYRASLSVPAETRPVVMLDMEAYNDLELTLAVMRRALSDTTLDDVRAGVVLQAYLPDSNAAHRALITWAQERRARGARPIRMRLVKGANLAHERVECAKSGLAVPIFAEKQKVDANFKRMLERAVTKEVLSAIELGVASHNLFDIAYTLVLREERDCAAGVSIEMLEGMADPLRRTLSELGVDVLVYAPICADDAMNTGIAYLVRRLDENTSPDNFLHSSFGMRPGDAAFTHERQRFLSSLSLVDGLDETPRRQQLGTASKRRRNPDSLDFRGEPDSDFARAEVRAALLPALAEVNEHHQGTVRSSIGGTWVDEGSRHEGVDPSRPGHSPYRVSRASAPKVEEALAVAHADPALFSQRTLADRAALLGRIAQGLRDARKELIATMVLDGGKRVVEADVEVSEAIDFAEYYRASFLEMARELPAHFSPRGVVLVTPPWNFPLAIPAGGVLAALMAGNRVIFKPALETALIAERLTRVMYRAGVPVEALQLVICEDEVASALVKDPRVSSVILTGATDTARLFQRMRPGLHLLAETGGKNGYIVTALSDRELAIRDVVHSAFGHSGQKCSAASLLVLEAEVHDDPAFMATLKDAVESLPVGPAWDARSFVTPLIHPPEGALKRALTTLEPGESWLVEPRFDADNPRLVSPGVKVGVAPGSFTHTSELFGPVLAVMRARDLDHATEIVNATGYGLTAGLASLDEREQARFTAQIRAGNVYVNRTITGAVVQRQPFGGYLKSGFGPGAKAGGPNYVLQLCHVRGRGTPPVDLAALDVPARAHLEALCAALGPAQASELCARASDYARADAAHFSKDHDPQKVLGQDNVFRYRTADNVVLRVQQDASLLDVASSCLAAEIAGVRLAISIDPAFTGPADATLWGHPVQVETAQQLVERLKGAVRLRVLGRRTSALERASELHGAHLADEPVLAVGRIELLHYLREQSISVDYHRYGNLGIRGQIPRGISPESTDSGRPRDR
jgi:RHH-type proline utilization regulon transcriptional repressor/proline dehydrogenase/delta 1-pyrroline-5-carboxylate dehydrogenase